MFKNYFKTSWRNIVRQRSSSLINVSGLAIGMSAAILIFLWVHNELNFDSYHKEAGNIYRIKNYLGINKQEVSVWENSPYLLGEKAKETIPGVINIARVRPMTYSPPFFNIKGEFVKETACAYIDSTWFDVFDYQFLHGSAAAFNNNPFSLVLTESKARKYFGSENPVGKTIRVDTINYQVEAVVKDNPANSSFQYDAFFSLAGFVANAKNKENVNYWGNYYFLTFLKLLPAADPLKVERKLTEIIVKERERSDFKAGLVSLQEMHFESDLDSSALEHGNKKLVSIFSVLGVLLLTIACINYVNLTTARASIRMKEVSVKKIVGADRKQLFAQFVLESALTSLLALFISLILINFILPFFNQFTGKNFVLSVNSTGIWMILIITFLASVILTSIYPAVLLSSFKPLSIFRGSNIFQVKDAVLRKALVVVQFTVSIALIIGTIVIYRQMRFIQKQSSSYNKSQLFSFTIPYKVLRNYKDQQRTGLTSSIKQELLAQSSIENVSLGGMESVINNQGWSSGESNDWDGRDKDFTPAITFFETDTSLKSLLNLEMQSGRWFLGNSEADRHNSILNETAVKEFNIKQPVIGQRFTSQGDTGVIIGVVKDFYYKSMHEKVGPVVLRNDQSYSGTYFVKTTAGKTIGAKERAENIWKKFFPAEPFSYQFFNDEFERVYRADHKASTLIWIFSFLAIFISCLGLYGLAAFTAERRSKEIGIRKVLGASVSGIVALLSKDFLRLVIISLIVASPLAWWTMNSWLQEFAYRVNIGWWIFIAAGVIALIIALASISFRAVKAATANPVRSLRTE